MNLKQTLRLRISRSKTILGASAPNVHHFLLSKRNPDGGFQNRDGQSDLYYTVFALDALIALDPEMSFDSTRQFLDAQSPDALDLVHLASFIRCASNLQLPLDPNALIPRLMRFATPDGGFNPIPNSPAGTLYGSYIAYGALEDLQVDYPDKHKLLILIESLKQPDQGYANSADFPISLTPPTSAGLTLLSLLGHPGNPQGLFKNFCPSGGVLASPEAPYPDLLSTATALAALSLMGVNLAPWREKTLDFIDSLWSSKGSFHGHWEDETLDCEYTFYGLLALGCLANP